MEIINTENNQINTQNEINNQINTQNENEINQINQNQINTQNENEINQINQNQINQNENEINQINQNQINQNENEINQINQNQINQNEIVKVDQVDDAEKVVFGVEVDNFRGKKIIASYYDEKTSLLFNRYVGITYYSSSHCQKKNSYVFHVTKQHLFTLMHNEEDFIFAKSIQNCQNEIRKCTANIVEVVKNGNTVTYEKITPDVVNGEKGYLEIFINKLKYKNFKVAYYQNGEIIGLRKLSFKGQLSLGANNQLKYLREKERDFAKIMLKMRELETAKKGINEKNEVDEIIEQVDSIKSNETIKHDDIEDFDFDDDDNDKKHKTVFTIYNDNNNKKIKTFLEC